MVILDMIGIDKLLVVREVIDGIFFLLTEHKVLPEGPVPEGKSILDWAFDYIHNEVHLSEEEIDEMERRYWQLLQENRDFLQIAQSFFADASVIRQLPNAELFVREFSEILITLINSLWGMIAFFPLLLRYLRHKDESLENGVKVFLSAVIVNIKSLLEIDALVQKSRERINKEFNGGTELN